MSTLAPPNSEDKHSRSVFVGNIPYDTSEEEIKAIFSQIGPIVTFRIMVDRDTGRQKGFGFCEYADAETANSAIRNLNGTQFYNRVLRVDSASCDKSKDELKAELAQQEATIVQKSPYGPVVDSNQAVDEIKKIVSSFSTENLCDVLKKLKTCVDHSPDETRETLIQNPQLCYAVLQALLILNVVDADQAKKMLLSKPPNYEGRIRTVDPHLSSIQAQTATVNDPNGGYTASSDSVSQYSNPPQGSGVVPESSGPDGKRVLGPNVPFQQKLFKPANQNTADPMMAQNQVVDPRVRASQSGDIKKPAATGQMANPNTNQGGHVIIEDKKNLLNNFSEFVNDRGEIIADYDTYKNPNHGNYLDYPNEGQKDFAEFSNQPPPIPADPHYSDYMSGQAGHSNNNFDYNAHSSGKNISNYTDYVSYDDYMDPNFNNDSNHYNYADDYHQQSTGTGSADFAHNNHNFAAGTNPTNSSRYNAASATNNHRRNHYVSGRGSSRYHDNGAKNDSSKRGATTGYMAPNNAENSNTDQMNFGGSSESGRQSNQPPSDVNPNYPASSSYMGSAYQRDGRNDFNRGRDQNGNRYDHHPPPNTPSPTINGGGSFEAKRNNYSNNKMPVDPRMKNQPNNMNRYDSNYQNSAPVRGNQAGNKYYAK